MPARIEESKPEVATARANLTGPERGYLLVADDNAADAALFRDALISNSYACDVVRSSEEMLRAFMVRDYDLILINLRLPLPSVYEAVRSIRNKERHYPEPKVPIFVLSAGVSEAERSRARDAGATDVVRKPSEYAGLQAILDGAVTGEPRTPHEMIPREPVRYIALLSQCKQDSVKAHQAIDELAGQINDTIRDVRIALEARDVELTKRAAEQLRQSASRAASGRIQRTALLLTRLTTPGRLQEQGRELLQELKAAQEDLALWREMKLGQTVVATKVAMAQPRTSILKLSSFLKNRLDIFSRAP